VRILHVWSRLHCRWLKWKGTYAAWKLLPHAAGVGCAMTVTLTVIHIHTKPPAVPVTPVEIPRYVYTIGIAQGETGTPDWIWADYPIAYLGSPEKHHHCRRHHDCKPVKYTVPEPATWALMLAGLGMVGRRRLNRG
jgi:PEP-CTERM motif